MGSTVLPAPQLLSPLGPVCITSNGTAITSVLFIDDDAVVTEASTDPLVAECARQLEAYFSGSLTQFDLPLAPVGTAFQQRVWEMLQQVSFGRTAAYGELALRLGNAKLTRAVGTANGSNPIAIIIPCHRIIGADGSLTGYAGGLWRKQWLLRHESGQKELF
ncbi:MAG: methylated-DNA--[protein]-cysteine S-methyltransferase [Flavobacteriales bacterium]|nr:methylated-DNA--[protein]-cysteine S-methyltransferase [Flavobacteriales bacterium]